jgi:AcrR family transcriptional regulator
VPKIVDVEERHRRVSEAAWRILVRDGPTDLSVRKVAAEAGLPPSSLRYTFPTQASVRDVAVELLVDRLSARVALTTQAPSPLERARAILFELLPLDDDRRMEMEVLLALGTMAMTDEALQRTHLRVLHAVRDLCAQALELANVPLDELQATHALVDGLALHLVRQAPGDDTAWAVQSLIIHLDRLRALAR